MRMPRLYLIVGLAALMVWTLGASRPQTPGFRYSQVMIPMRDGVRLQTVILTPVGAEPQLPILFRRTPYGVPANANGMGSPALKELEHDGYIFVIQNLRGRFQSEG